MKKLIILTLYCMISYNSGCKPEQCDDFKKCNGPESSTRITAYLSNTDSVLHVGDTLRYYIRVPDTLLITYGPELNNKIFVKKLADSYDDNFVLFQTNSGDSVINGAIDGLFFKGTPYSGLKPLGISHVAVKHGNGHLQIPRYLKFRSDTRDIECYFVFSRVGRFVIISYSHALAFITTDGRRKFLSGNINFADAKTRRIIRPRYSQYLKHMDSSARAAVQARFDKEFDGTSWYYLEVKE